MAKNNQATARPTGNRYSLRIPQNRKSKRAEYNNRSDQVRKMAEIEGELKKRVLLIAGKGNLKPLLSPQDVANKVGDVLGEVFEILDEVKADFPNENDEKYKDRDIPMFPNQRGGDYYKFRYDQYIDDVKLWFKSYLGSKTGKSSSAGEPQQP
jgi:hypothetical protein